ncbi:hypothetical protein PS1_015471 [Malus domestica]
MKYLCFGVTWLKRCFQGGRKLSMLRGLVADVFLARKKSQAFVFSGRKKTKYVERFGCRCILGRGEESSILDVCLAMEDEGRTI